MQWAFDPQVNVNVYVGKVPHVLNRDTHLLKSVFCALYLDKANYLCVVQAFMGLHFFLSRSF